MVRSAKAVWEGDFLHGNGTVDVESGLFSGKYSFPSRFESGTGTNPEELLGAAHASCFSMALSAMLGESGYIPQKISTKAIVHIDRDMKGFKIAVDLETEAKVPDIKSEEFQEIAQKAKIGCPVSKALASIEITLKAVLVE